MSLTPKRFLDALLSMPALRSAQVSPDGRWVAWSWLRVGPSADVFVAPSDGSAPPLRLTDTKEHTMLVSWSPDSRHLIVDQDHDGDEKVRLYLLPIDQPGALHPLTSPSPPYFIRGGEMHPNLRWLVYGANRDPETGLAIEQTLIYRHDLKTGERKVLATPKKGAFVMPELSPTGEHVLYTRKDRHPSGRQMWLVDIEGREDKEIINAGDSRKVSGTWLEDGRRILFLAQAEKHRRVGIYDIRNGEARWLIDDPSRNIEDVAFPTNSPLAVITEIREARVRCSFLDPDSGEEYPLGDLPGNLIPLAPRPDGQWVGMYYSSRQPADLIAFDPKRPAPHEAPSLTGLWDRTHLRPVDFSQAVDFRWRSVDGLEIQGWLHRPAGEAVGTVLYVHGGPTAHTQDRMSAEVAYYVKRGFNVLEPNYRGSTGFGLAFTEAIKEDGWGGREQEDLRTAIHALFERGIAQPGRVAMTGTSYGGYSSWCAVTRFTRDELAAAAPVCGMTDLVVDYETTRPDLRPYSEEMMGGSPDQVPERYHRGSPIHFVQNMVGRLLIVQGTRDPNVTPENVRAVQTALDHAGKTYEVLMFADEGHGITRPKNQRWLYPRLADLFQQAFDEG